MPTIRPIDRWFITHVAPHEAGFLALAQRLTGSKEEASDLVHEAYARLFSANGWASIAHPQAYMRRAIRHIAIERFRRAKIVDFQQLVEADHDGLEDDAPGPFSVAAGRDAFRRFSDALARLPERCRDVFVRRRIQEQSPAQISAELGVSVSALEKRLARAIFLLTQEGGGGPSSDPDDTLHPPRDIANGS